MDYKDDPDWKQWRKPALQKVFLRLRPGEYMNGMDCEECSKSCNDMRERDQFGTMPYYCDKSIVAWNLRDGDEGDDGKDGEICRLVLCRGCFVVRNGRVDGRRQRAWCGN